MNSSQFDKYLDFDGPAALVIREPLMPVEGRDGILFPATYAAGDGFPGGYNIDEFDEGKKNICLIDSVGSQANRLEPLFAEEKYKHLVPQLVIVFGEKQLTVFEAGHRAGDALVRCTELQQKIEPAFLAAIKGDIEPLAKITPTSLVFGVWDSRGTQAKLPRLVASTIRAFDVRRLHRSAQFNPATDYVGDKLLEEPTDKTQKDAYAERGFVHVPAAWNHGGIQATGGIRRDATLMLAALRTLRAGKDTDRTLKLQRYILGLSLVAFTANAAGYLRQGCLLVQDPDQPREMVEVLSTGERIACKITPQEALAYATAVAQDFGVGESKVVEFDKNLAKSDVAGDAEAKEKKAAAKAAKKTAKKGA